MTTLIQTHCDACGGLVYEREPNGERPSEQERDEEDGGKQDAGISL